MVSIMPGIDTAAPERTETSRGSSLVAELPAGGGLQPLQRGSTWVRSAGGNCWFSR